MPIKQIVISDSDLESDWIKKVKRKPTKPPAQTGKAHLAIVAGYLDAWSQDGLVVRHLGGKHNQKLHSGGGGSATPKVWDGKPVAWEGKKLSKLQVGEIGENLAMRVLSEQMGVEFKTLNAGLNNAPIDVGGDHTAVEVKTGLASNGRSAQQWRATIGQPGKAETAALKQMTSEEKRAHNQYKQRKILERKQAMLDEMSKVAGTPIKGATVGIILHPDGTKGDVYKFDGFHLRVPWKKANELGKFMGTFNV